MVYGHGAFELCLPSLGFFFTKLWLRSERLGQASHMAPSWVKVQTLAEHDGLQHYEVSTLEAEPHHDDHAEQGHTVQSQYEPVHQ